MGLACHVLLFLDFVAALAHLHLRYCVHHFCQQWHLQDAGQPDDYYFPHQACPIFTKLPQVAPPLIHHEIVYAEEVVRVQFIPVQVDLNGVVEIRKIVIAYYLIDIDQICDEITELLFAAVVGALLDESVHLLNCPVQLLHRVSHVHDQFLVLFLLWQSSQELNQLVLCF